MTQSNERKIEVGTVVVSGGGCLGGPAMRVTGLGFLSDVPSPGPSVKVASVRPNDKDGTKPAWTGEFLVAGLRILPEDHHARRAPFYDFDLS